MTLSVGQEAPDFELVGTAPAPFRLSSLRGKKNAVVAFYELAFNDDDTAEMEAFQELQPQFEAADTEIIAISLDPKGLQDAFASACGLSFTLLGDTFTHEVCSLYDAWRDDRGFASETGGVARRVTYVIDKEGKVRGAVENAPDVRQHADEALRLVQQLQKS